MMFFFLCYFSQEYEKLDQHKKTVKERERVLKRREERAGREYDNAVSQVRGGGGNLEEASGAARPSTTTHNLSSTNSVSSTPVRSSRGHQKEDEVASLANSMSVRKSLREDDVEVRKLRVLREQGREQVSRFREYCTENQLHDLNILMQRLFQEEREEERMMKSSSIVDRAMVSFQLILDDYLFSFISDDTNN
jgi:hypothetical protein